METQEDSKKKREFYNRPWFWIIVGVVVLVAIGSSQSSTNTPQPVVQEPEVTAPAPSVEKPASQPVQKTLEAASGSTSNTNANTAAAPAATPAPAPQATWHTVATFSGSGDTNTNDFTIQGSKWRIDWSFAFPASTESYCEQNGCNMAVQIFQDDGTYVDQFLETGQQPSSGTVYEYSGTGNMYMHVIQGNVTWNLTVEDYY